MDSLEDSMFQESLMNTLAELEKAFDEAINDPQFIKRLYVLS